MSQFPLVYPVLLTDVTRTGFSGGMVNLLNKDLHVAAVESGA